MRLGSLFSGIGGFELGLERAGCEVIWQVEVDPFCRAVLAKHWPSVQRYPDVHFVSAAQLEPVDIISGGFPCQDLSAAGRRAGLRGHRSGLWREYRRLLHEMRPRWALIENVHHTWRSWVPSVRSDLGQLGYASVPVRLRASDFGAPHERARCFIVAAPDGDGEQLRELSRRCRGEGWPAGQDESRVAGSARQTADAGSVGASQSNAGQASERHSWEARETSECGSIVRRATSDADSVRELQPSGPVGAQWRRPSDCDWWATEPEVARVVHGVPARVDGRRRRAREYSLGNAIIPQAAEFLGRLIMEVSQ